MIRLAGGHSRPKELCSSLSRKVLAGVVHIVSIGHLSSCLEVRRDRQWYFTVKYKRAEEFYCLLRALLMLDS